MLLLVLLLRWLLVVLVLLRGGGEVGIWRRGWVAREGGRGVGGGVEWGAGEL